MDYKNAGVDIEAGYKSVELMKEHVKKTMRESDRTGRVWTDRTDQTGVGKAITDLCEEFYRSGKFTGHDL